MPAHKEPLLPRVDEPVVAAAETGAKADGGEGESTDKHGGNDAKSDSNDSAANDSDSVAGSGEDGDGEYKL